MKKLRVCTQNVTFYLLTQGEHIQPISYLAIHMADWLALDLSICGLLYRDKFHI